MFIGRLVCQPILDHCGVKKSKKVQHGPPGAGEEQALSYNEALPMVKSRAGLDGPRAAPGRSGFPDQFEIGAAESIRSAYRPLKPRTDEQPCHLSEEDPQYICSPAQSGLLPHSIESVQLWPGFHKCCVNNQQYIVVIVIFCLVSIGCLRNWLLICSD